MKRNLPPAFVCLLGESRGTRRSATYGPLEKSNGGHEWHERLVDEMHPTAGRPQFSTRGGAVLLIFEFPRPKNRRLGQCATAVFL
jgi:hypothetical protein